MANKDTNQHPDEEGIMTLMLDDSTELDCKVLTIFEVEDQEYIVLLPLEDSDGECFIYRYFDDENDEFHLENIEDDEEFEKVSDAFDEFLDSCEYDELVDEEDL